MTKLKRLRKKDKLFNLVNLFFLPTHPKLMHLKRINPQHN